jgi:phospholipid/cholesterol/gamma-HCH transport system ATP-binding protein
MEATEDAMTDSARVLLAAEGLRIAARGTLPALAIDLTLGAGDLLLVHTRHKAHSTAIADGLLGLGETDADRVRYLDAVWSELTMREAFARRRGVGRIRSQGHWMETRSVMENVLLPSMHHTILPEDRLRESASALALRFGLPGLPTALPDECTNADLERAACVQAFLGRPTLVILEHPMEFEDSSLLTPMMNAIQQVRRRGGSVIWFTEHSAHLVDASIPASRRYRLVGAQLVDLGQPQ